MDGDDAVGEQSHAGDGMKGQDGEEPSTLSESLRGYLDDVFNRVPLRSKYKQELREELETHLEDASEELLDLGYKPYAADEQIIRRMERPEVLADDYRRLESLRSWFRDPVCVRAMMLVAIGYIGFVVITKVLYLLVGFSASDFQVAYDLERHLIDARWIAAILSGALAYWVYYARTGNPYRFTPFVTLSVVAFIVTNLLEVQYNFISSFPNPECRFFLIVDLPSPVAHIPFLARLFMVFEVEMLGTAIKFLENGFRYKILPNLPYTPDAPSTIMTYVLCVVLATSFLFERLKQRQSLEAV